MIFYFGVITYIFVIYIIISNYFPKNKKTLLFLTLFPLWIIVSFRNYTIGNDTYEYLRLFDSIKNSSDLTSFTSRYEIGYVYLNKFISYFSSNSQSVLFVTSCITYIGYSNFIHKYSNNVGLSVLLFVLMGYFGQTMNVVRFQLALVILLYSFDKLVEGKTFKFVFLVLIAFLFHKTALMFILVIFIKKIKLNKKSITIISAITVVVYILFSKLYPIISRLFNYYTDYSSSNYLDGEVRLASILYFLMSLSILVFIFIVRKNNRKYKEQSVNEDFMLMLLFIGTCILFISFKFNLLDRVSDYFRVYTIVLLPNILQFVNDKYKKLLYSFSIVLLFLVYFSFIHISKPEWNNIYPYETWLKKE